jgi:hypothetical protein
MGSILLHINTIELHTKKNKKVTYSKLFLSFEIFEIFSKKTQKLSKKSQKLKNK